MWEGRLGSALQHHLGLRSDTVTLWWRHHHNRSQGEKNAHTHKLKKKAKTQWLSDANSKTARKKQSLSARDNRYDHDQSVSVLVKLFPDVKYFYCQIESNVCMASYAKTHASQQHPETCKKYLDVTQMPQTEVICWQSETLYSVYMLNRDLMKSWGNVFYSTWDVMLSADEGQVVIVLGWLQRPSWESNLIFLIW